MALMNSVTFEVITTVKINTVLVGWLVGTGILEEYAA
jgi:hypothetical protein